MIVTNQKRMINSLLSKEIKSIKIDRLIIATETNEKILLTEPEDILREVSNQFTELKKKRKHNFDNISSKWIKIYASLAHISDKIYEKILDSLTQEEWIMALRIITNTSVLGISNIDYLLLKKISAYVREILIKFIGIIIKLAIIPLE
jgi:hypothetical protein